MRPIGKQRAYDRGMLREDLSGRFDYLFEPLEIEESAGDGGDDAATDVLAQPGDDARWSRRIVLTGVVLATLAAAAATAVVMLQPAQQGQPIIAPTDATPLSTPVATATSPAMPSPMPTATPSPVQVLPVTVNSSAEPIATRAPAAVPAVAPPPQSQAPTAVSSEPPKPMPPPPTTRAPISVSPESRAPFPNQTPPRKNDDGGGGLLGGLF
jgi:hypothetical protein